MKIKQVINNKKSLKLIIDYDENVGFYLIVYRINSDISIADYLCDTLKQAFFEAKDRFDIEYDSWEDF